MLRRVSIDELKVDEPNQLIVGLIIFAQDARLISSQGQKFQDLEGIGDPKWYSTISRSWVTSIFILGWPRPAEDKSRIRSEKLGRPRIDATFGHEKEGEPRAVWNLTLRDAETSTINVATWGHPSDIQDYTHSFRIKDVVEVHNPRVQTPREESNYTPEVTSPFQLTISVGQQNACIVPHEAPPSEIEKLQGLASIPTKTPLAFVSLGDVRNTSNAMTGTLLNLLVAVRSVGVTRSKKSRGGQDSVLRTVSVFDQSGVANSLPMQIWNSIVAERAAYWAPRKTVLFIADARLGWNAYRRGLEIRLTSRSVITEDPDTEEASRLREYARTASLNSVSALDQLTSLMLDPSTVQNVMTVAAIMSRCRGVQSSIETAAQTDSDAATRSAYSVSLAEEHFTAVLFAAVTRFDLDGPRDRVLKPACTNCHALINIDDGNCLSSECANRLDRDVDVVFDIRVNLSDHTGTLHNCRLTGDVASAVVGCTAAEFQELSLNVTTQLKWLYLLERCVARIVVLPTSEDRRDPLVSLLSLDLADPAEVAQQMPMQ